MATPYWQETPVDRSPKRLKRWDSDDDSGDELFDNETIATLPVNYGEQATLPVHYGPPTASMGAPGFDEILSSSPPATVPTQLLGPGTPNKSDVTRVVASSPIIKESPRPTTALQNIMTTNPNLSSPLSNRGSATATTPSRTDSVFLPPARPSPMSMNSLASSYGSSRPRPPPSAPVPRQPIVKIDLTDTSVVPYAGSSSGDEDIPEVVPATNFYLQNGSGRKTTSSFAARQRTDAGGSPSANSVAGKFAHLSYEARDASRKQQLDDLKAEFERSQKLTPLSPLTPGLARKKLVQRGPERAVMPDIWDMAPMGLSASTKGNLERLRTVFPQYATRQQVLLSALTRFKGNYDDASAYLAEAADEDVQEIPPPKEKTTKRNELKKPQKSVFEKFSSTQTAAVARSKKTPPPQSPVKVVEEPRRRRLVKAGERKKVELESEDEKEEPIQIETDSDSAADNNGFDEEEYKLEQNVLEFINKCTPAELVDVSYTTEEIANVILALKPFKTLNEIREVTSQTVNKAGKRGTARKAVGDKVVDMSLETWRGYEAVDTLIETCDKMGKIVTDGIKAWGVNIFGARENGELDLVDVNIDQQKDSAIGTPSVEGSTKGEPTISTDPAVAEKQIAAKGSFLHRQPKNMADNVTLKDYQIVGVNWLSLLYKNRLSCILADEMGLGKTCQVIAFLAHLKETGVKGPHLVVVPSSTLENWLREFARFCPDLKVEPYYGSQGEREAMRDVLIDANFDVLVTTYNMAVGSSAAGKMDFKFLRNLHFNVCVYDEGHMLKNSTSSRYANLMKLKANFRLLLTGTPLQNNLQELVSLLAFILPKVFLEKQEDLQGVFKFKAKTTDDAESNNALLSVERIRRARSMMTPFVLRRRKEQVLKDLPAKSKSVIYCELNDAQKDIYEAQEARARQALLDRENGIKPDKDTNNTNLLMQLRKAALHPLLFRRIYDDATIKKMSKDIMKEPEYCGENVRQDFIFEDMEVMNDFELDRLCKKFPRTMSKYALKNKEWMDAGKVVELKRLLLKMTAAGDRVLLFSQFTLVLDVLELVVNTLDLPFLRLDGSTNVQLRQDLIDQFHNEKDITVFLLSTKAGGFGINLACANKVIIFDSSFNPMDDLQSEDRAHRVGQTREVEVLRLITKGTVEENILNLANTKLALDASLSGVDDAAKAGAAVEKKGEDMVMNMLKRKVVEEVTAETKKEEPESSGRSMKRSASVDEVEADENEEEDGPKKKRKKKV